MIGERSLRIRAQEIILSSPEGMTVREGMKRALAERFKNDPSGLLEFAATAGSASMKDLRRRTYDLPDDAEQGLFEIPAVIGIRTPDGDLLVPREMASLGQVRQWAREAAQHHATQKLRFKRFRADLDRLKDEPDELPWWSARAICALDGDE